MPGAFPDAKSEILNNQMFNSGRCGFDRVRISRQLQPVRPPGVAVHILPLTPHELDTGLKDLVELPDLPPSGPGSGRE